MQEWYSDSENVYIITDVCEGGELFDLVRARFSARAMRCIIMIALVWLMADLTMQAPHGIAGWMLCVEVECVLGFNSGFDQRPCHIASLLPECWVSEIWGLLRSVPVSPVAL